ncbi:non-ribosomal peptide synthetase [Pedobacter fastidiosus]|uniref:Amino acid adenylation domain-containing protein n=1 Tax=Pedobacter fastidiosus TaxID=2765361 RepID=A0ABR7KVF5_9SPHI|nr:non-ribosomal peptide synthetase [Pedobacter fastidiosus]MBC6112098.1 amino acid adenylation domain-containing protein [Pedobacter fastidiosus]
MITQELETNFIEVDFDPFEDNKEIEKIINLNESQKEIWLSCIIGGTPANLAYNESVSLQLEGELDLNTFQKSLEYLTQRHESLRAGLSQNGENLIIYKKIIPTIHFEDLSKRNEENIDEILTSFIEDEISIPFDLYNDTLFKIYIHKTKQNTHHFTIIIHHIIGDGWSIGIILEDLSKIYNALLKGEQPKLEPVDQISKYAKEQVDFAKTEEYEITQNFWVDKYKEDVPVLSLPMDFNRPSVRTYEGKRKDQLVDYKLQKAIKNLSNKAHCSVVTTLITLFEVYLYHRSGQEDIILGLPAAGQLATENLNLVGHCVNLLPLRSKIIPELPFLDYLKIRKNEIYDVYEHQKLTFSELLKKIASKRDRANIPLVPVVFNVDMAMDERVKFDGLNHKIFSNPRVCQTFEISLNVNGSKEAMIFEWAYNTQLFSSETIDEMMFEFTALIEKVTSDDQVLIGNAITRSNPFPTVTPNFVDYPKDKNFVDLFEEQAQLNPNKIALRFEESDLSYKFLDEKANQLANYLTAQNIGKNSLVPICLQPSLEMVIAIIGILKAGAAYVPIDPDYPINRIKYLIEECKSTILVSDLFNLSKFENSIQANIIALNNSKSGVWKEKKTFEKATVEANSLVYVIYTSGSTGNPKGVMISHKSLSDYLFGLSNKLPLLRNCKSYALGSAISTDLGNTTLYSALSLGAELHLFAKDRFNDVSYIHDYFKKYSIDFLKIVPSHWKYLMFGKQPLLPNKALMFGGESLPEEFINLIKQAKNTCEIINHYGPTETTIGKLLHIVDQTKDYNGSVPIGQPFSNTSVYVLNSAMKYSPVGVPGELYIGGDGVAEGYLNNLELTNKSFVHNPFSENQHKKIYKTGDLVKWLDNGHIQYLGRIDEQVKIRGNRIELGEIQNILQKYPDVKQSAVIVDETDVDNKQLIAYIVSESELDKEKIIQFLRSQLPEYMIPRTLVKVDKIPLTSNGKIDRKLLPSPTLIDLHTENNFVAPQNGIQELISKIWSEHLGINEISIKDDFFELGGHSMIAIKVMIEIEKQTGKRLPLASLFDHPTIEKISTQLNPSEGKRWDSLVPIKTTGTKNPVYLIHGGGLNVLVFRSMSKYLDAEQPVYALQALGLNGETTLYYTIEEIANKYISEILEQNPDGPYLIAGYSLGGKIAYEMANQLLKMGKKIEMLGIFDTYNPTSKTGLNKIALKIMRQLKKIPFMLNRLTTEPKETLDYQYLIAKNKIKNKFTTSVAKEDVFTHDPEIIRSYDVAYDSYRIKPIDLEVDLFRVKKRIYFLDDPIYLGWKDYAKQGINIHEVPGDHKTFLFPPNDKEFAEILQKTLDSK